MEVFKHCDAHIAACEVIVCAVNNSSVVYHKVKTDCKGNKDKSPKTDFCEYIIHCGHCETVAAHNNLCYCKTEIEKCANYNDDCVTFKADTAESIVYGPFPGCIGVTVEDDSSLNFTLTLFDSRNVMAGLFLEKRVKKLFINTELNKNNGKACKNQRN